MNRRQFLGTSATAAAGLALGGCATTSSSNRPPFEISLAEWSLHRAIFGRAGTKIDHLDFAVVAKRDFGIQAVELVNQFFFDKAADPAYLKELKRRADGEGVRMLLIMCDREGALGDPDAAKRQEAVRNHHKWADAAKYLGCHSIRVNADSRGVGSPEEQAKRAAEGLRSLSQYCATLGLNCLVENHGGLSSNGAWLAGVMRQVALPNCGTLPDFGNFRVAEGNEYDRYLGVKELMPFAKAVSAKSHDFDGSGQETHTDYQRMMKIVLDSGYHGYVGIEYEGDKLSEYDGIRATLALLNRIRAGA